MSERKESVEVTLPNGVKMRFCRIPAGSFRMGSRGGPANEEPVTEVRVEEFWMAETPVTQEQFAAWRETADYVRWFEENREIIKKSSWNRNEAAELHENRFQEQAKYPADSVTWWEGRAFGAWLGQQGMLASFLEKAGLAPDEQWHFDLPTEAQWEKACRAGSETAYWNGDGEASLAEVAFYGEGWEEGSTYPVGSRQRENALGLHDCHGNVWEWCREAWDGQEATSRLRVPGDLEPEGSASEGEAEYRVLRGGSWDVTAGLCRSACRLGFGPGDRNRLIGFRLAVVPGPSSQDQRPEAQGGAEPEAAAVEARDEPEQAQAGGGADLSGESFPPRSGDNN